MFIFTIVFYSLAALGLCCCAQAFSGCGKGGGLLSSCSVQVSRGGFSCGEQALGVRASVVVACGLKSVDPVIVVHGHVGSSWTRDQSWQADS